MIYEGSPSAHLDSIAQTLMERLQARFRCLYLNSPTMVAGMRSRLAAAGLDVQEQVKRGALILSSDQGHLVDGKFDTERMIAALRDAMQRALTDGYVGLWAAGDMTWEFGSEDNLSKLLEYERRLEECMHANPALCGICLYHRDTLPPAAIDLARVIHPAQYVNATLSRLNPLHGT